MPLDQSHDSRWPQYQRATSVVFTATFNGAVNGVIASDFAAVTSGTVAYSGLNVARLSNSVYTITISGINGAGTIGLNLNDNSAIRDAGGNPLQPTAATAATFLSPTTISTGVGVEEYVTAADVNNDGKPDVVIAGTNNLVILGNGNGTFGSPKIFGTNTNGAPGVAVGDLNNDGKSDVVTADGFGTTTVTVSLGNGDGTFKSGRTISVGTQPTNVVMADVNGDGKADLVVLSNLNSGSVSVLLGNGDGTFGAPVNYTVGTTPTSLTLSDVNGDGKQDIVVANGGTNSLGILLGNGNGTFQAQKTIASTSPIFVTSADVNGDGKRDLIVSNGPALFTNFISVFLGNGNGTFKSATTFAGAPLNIAIADINGDGIPDLVTDGDVIGGGFVNFVQTYLGNGNDALYPGAANLCGGAPIGCHMGFRHWRISTATAGLDVLYRQRRESLAELGSSPPAPNASFAGQAYTIVGQATQVAITTAPTGGQAGTGIGTVVVTVEQSNGTVASADNSPVTLTLNTGTFSHREATASPSTTSTASQLSPAWR